MNDTQHAKEQPIAEFQRIRLAHDQGRNGEHLPATRGNFSERFYNTLSAALRLAPSLVEHVLTIMTINGGSEDKVDGSRDAPLPMNTQAFNDVNEVYSRLVYWAVLWAEKLHRQAPGPAKRAWSASSTGHIMGLPADITPADARYVVGIMSKWLEVNLEDILGTPVVDDVQFFHDEFAQDIFRINTANPRKAKPRYSDMPCPLCGAKVAMYPPERFGDDEKIVCEGVGHWFIPAEYEELLKSYREMRTEKATAEKVKAHLLRTYGQTA